MYNKIDLFSLIVFIEKCPKQNMAQNKRLVSSSSTGEYKYNEVLSLKNIQVIAIHQH
jgi:hypothetical protein